MTLRPFDPDSTPPDRDAEPREHAAFLRDELIRALRLPQFVRWLNRHLPGSDESKTPHGN